MVQHISCCAKACLLTCALLLFIGVFPAQGGEYFYIYSCRLGCKDKGRRKRDTIYVIAPYWPYGLVHTYMKIWNPRRRTYRCYEYGQHGVRSGDCSSVVPCCDRSYERSLRKSGYTDCPEIAENFGSYFSGFTYDFWGHPKRRNYDVGFWNCQVFVNMLRRYLLSCDSLSTYGYMYLDGYGSDK